MSKTYAKIAAIKQLVHFAPHKNGAVAEIRDIFRLHDPWLRRTIQ